MLLGLVFTFSLAMAVQATAHTAITYQGQLHNAGGPFSGTADMEFRVYDDPSGGSQAGSEVLIPGVPVQNGLFQVELDFGGEVPFEQGLWLQVTVDGVDLIPRQPITAAPLALRTLSGTDAVWTVSGTNIFYTQGHVGIGTDNVNQGRLQVHGGDTRAVRAINQSNNNATIWATNIGTGFGLYVDGAAGSRNYFQQPVGIGTENPEAMLHVRPPPPPATEDALRVAGRDDTDGLLVRWDGAIGIGAPNIFANIQLYVRGRAGGTALQVAGSPSAAGLQVRSNGGVSIGSFSHDTPADGLRVQGLVELVELGEAGGASLCRNSNGHIANCASSARYKKDIVNLETATELIERMRAVSFRWQETDEQDIGLIAEEVAEIEPRLAVYDKDGHVIGVKYRHLAAVLVKAFQEQQARHAEEIVALQARLEEETSKTSRRLAALEALMLGESEDHVAWTEVKP